MEPAGYIDNSCGIDDAMSVDRGGNKLPASGLSGGNNTRRHLRCAMTSVVVGITISSGYFLYMVTASGIVFQRGSRCSCKR